MKSVLGYSENTVYFKKGFAMSIHQFLFVSFFLVLSLSMIAVSLLSIPMMFFNIYWGYIMLGIVAVSLPVVREMSLTIQSH